MPLIKQEPVNDDVPLVGIAWMEDMMKHNIKVEKDKKTVRKQSNLKSMKIVKARTSTKTKKLSTKTKVELDLDESLVWPNKSFAEKTLKYGTNQKTCRIETRPRWASKSRAEIKPRTSIPQDGSLAEFPAQCIEAAFASRLSPYTLHPAENQMLRNHISHIQVTIYLNIRNRILRLWQRNPLVSVTRAEAAGCARDQRFLDIADVAYEWLMRNGYINFGCIEVPCPVDIPPPTRRKRTIVVIGGGISGLGTARQLEGLLRQYSDRFIDQADIPNVVVLEARSRLGGRIYSHPLKTTSESNKIRHAVDLGGQIVTGFEGNPIAVIFRGQLGLPYHMLTDNVPLYDVDGMVVNNDCDMRCEKLHNDVLDRVSIFKHNSTPLRIVEGNKQLIDTSKDPAGDGGEIIARVEENEVELPPLPPSPISRHRIPFLAPFAEETPERTTSSMRPNDQLPTAEQLRNLGWNLKPNNIVGGSNIMNPMRKANTSGFNVLGKTMDGILEQYQSLVEITPQDLRVINWHIANLEYANAAKTDDLSLEHWDQDDGNEFSGGHAMVIGGYSQVPRGLYLAPSRLDVRVCHVVKKISYSKATGTAVVECNNGTTIEAEKVIVTIPLGVMKEKNIIYEPALPAWKSAAIDRLGFGLLNKVVLVYDKPFWDTENDMIGQLRDCEGDNRQQSNYEEKRGRFYMFWNCIKVTGLPVLVALMAGEAAQQTEFDSDQDLIYEATELLRKIFPGQSVPNPRETVVTRWKSDPYSKGTYSYVGPGSSGEDYDLIAKPVDDVLFFAGEATCKTHPATVHGAYISGLKAAADVVTCILGPIDIPTPLVPSRSKIGVPVYPPLGARRTAKEADDREIIIKMEIDQKSEENMVTALHDAIGYRPSKPGRTGVNPFLLYQKDYWLICKENCDRERQKETGNSDAKASRNEVRAALGLMWREAPMEIKKPYLDEVASNKLTNIVATSKFHKLVSDWDAAAERFKIQWREKRESANEICASSIPFEEDPPTKRQKSTTT